MNSLAIQRGFSQPVILPYLPINSNLQLAQESPLNYSEEQLRALYRDLFASLPSITQSIEDSEPPPHSLYTLLERFQIKSDNRLYRALIDHISQALTFAAETELQLGLVLDSEWETILGGAVCMNKFQSLTY